MSGVRIHHPMLRSCVLLVPHPGSDLRSPKEYHIHLDADGNSIVSSTVWSRLMEARSLGLSPHEFVVMNEVPAPPTLLVSKKTGVAVSRVYRQRPDGISTTGLMEIAQQFAPKGITPRITRGSDG